MVVHSSDKSNLFSKVTKMEGFGDAGVECAELVLYYQKCAALTKSFHICAPCLFEQFVEKDSLPQNVAPEMELLMIGGPKSRVIPSPVCHSAH